MPAWMHRATDGVHHDAVLDVEALCPELGLAWFFDATVRNPLAKRYRKSATIGIDFGNAASLDSFSCRLAHEEKQKRYPPRDDICCKTMALEVFGRMGDEMASHLQALASMAKQQDVDFGRPQVNWFRRWSCSISCGVARCVARCIESSVVAKSMLRRDGS